MADAKVKVAAGVVTVGTVGVLAAHLYRHSDYYFGGKKTVSGERALVVADDNSGFFGTLQSIKDTATDYVEDAMDLVSEQSEAAAIVIQRRYRAYKKSAVDTYEAVLDAGAAVADLATDLATDPMQLKYMLYEQLAWTAAPYAGSVCVCWGGFWAGKKWAQRVKRARELKRVKRVGAFIKAAAHAPAGLLGTVLGLGLYGTFGP